MQRTFVRRLLRVPRRLHLFPAVMLLALVMLWGLPTEARAEMGPPADTAECGAEPQAGHDASLAPQAPQTGVPQAKVKAKQQEQDSLAVQPPPTDPRVRRSAAATRSRIQRSSRRFDRDMRQLDSTIRTMNITIQRLRTLNRRR